MEVGVSKDGRVSSTLVVSSINEITTATSAPHGPTDGKVNVQNDLVYRFKEAYHRLADSAGQSAGFDGKPVRKVSVDSIREELKRRGWLDVDEKNSILEKDRKAFGRAREANLRDHNFVQDNGFIWLT